MIKLVIMEVSLRTEEFEDKGFISKIQKENLEPILDAGHATMHRSFNPSKEDLLILMDVAESLIESIYINPRKAKKLAKKIPPREKKRKKLNETLSKLRK